MAIKHELNLEFPETKNDKIFRVEDTSVYADELDVSCGLLQIQAPGYTNAVAIEVEQGFDLVLNACYLGIADEGDCGECSPVLPDGIYHVKYSVSPNELVYVEYYILRTTHTMALYAKEMCKLDLNACEPPKEIKDKLEKLRLIRDFIDAARIKVEDCHDTQKGIALFSWAVKKLNQYRNKSC